MQNVPDFFNVEDASQGISRELGPGLKCPDFCRRQRDALDRHFGA